MTARQAPDRADGRAPDTGAARRDADMTAHGAQVIRSRDLLGGAQEIVIEHNRRAYRLRVTALGKLILTA